MTETKKPGSFTGRKHTPEARAKMSAAAAASTEDRQATYWGAAKRIKRTAQGPAINLEHPGGKWACGCLQCRAFRSTFHSKAARMERIAAEMRERNQRVMRIRATVKERRGHGRYYPSQPEVAA